jgi:hypothetical protein
MPELIRAPSRVAAAGEPLKLIDEYVGRAPHPQAAAAGRNVSIGPYAPAWPISRSG